MRFGRLSAAAQQDRVWPGLPPPAAVTGRPGLRPAPPEYFRGLCFLVRRTGPVVARPTRTRLLRPAPRRDSDADD